MKHKKTALTETKFKKKLCECLLRYDPSIVEIIQFGSSVYAPEYARDVDLLVLTETDKKPTDYIDCISDLDLPFDVDVVVSQPGSPLNNKLTYNVLGAYEILYGQGKYLVEATKGFDPTFEDAKATLKAAVKYLEDAKETTELGLKDIHLRNAYNALFHAARLASMVYLSIEIGRWGKIKRKLSKKYRVEFEDFINILHIDYFYNGNYPEEDFEEDFENWYMRVEDYVKKLESDVKKSARNK